MLLGSPATSVFCLAPPRTDNTDSSTRFRRCLTNQNSVYFPARAGYCRVFIDPFGSVVGSELDFKANDAVNPAWNAEEPNGDIFRTAQLGAAPRGI
jgi:hypothetical protein